MFKKCLKAAAIGLFCIATSVTAPAHDSGPEPFRLLKVSGNYVRWPLPTSGPLVLTYKIVNKPTAVPPGGNNCKGLTSFDDLAAKSNLTVDAIKAEVEHAFRSWEAVANIKFRESETDNADILIGAQMDPTGWAFAEVYTDQYAVGEFKPIKKGLACFNPLVPWKIGFDGDLKAYDLRFTFTHEIGHVIGLDHPRNGEATIMGFKYHERFRTPQAGDSVAAAMLYGKPFTILVRKAE